MRGRKRAKEKRERGGESQQANKQGVNDDSRLGVAAGLATKNFLAASQAGELLPILALPPTADGHFDWPD